MKLFDMLTDEDVKRIKKEQGPLDLSLQVDSLLLENKKLKEKIRELEGKCREAGRAMIELNLKYETNIKELDRLSEENTNLKTMIKGKDGNK
mgnify:CR=1 FL=1